MSVELTLTEYEPIYIESAGFRSRLGENKLEIKL